MAPKLKTVKLKTVKPPTTKKRQSVFQIFIILTAVAFGILTFLVKLNPSLPFDLVITRAIQSINFPGFETLMVFLTELGNGWEEVILPVLVIAYLLSLKKHQEALMLFISTVGVGLISETFKQIVARPRPDHTLIIQIGQYARHDSFPSGHVLFYMGFFGFLIYLVYTRLQKNLLQKILLLIFGTMILLIGVSRIYLGAHWFSDTLGSYLIGTVWLYILIRLTPKPKS